MSGDNKPSDTVESVRSKRLCAPAQSLFYIGCGHIYPATGGKLFLIEPEGAFFEKRQADIHNICVIEQAPVSGNFLKCSFFT
jgi:hypothetical protein